jgi:hypothetical protein
MVHHLNFPVVFLDRQFPCRWIEIGGLIHWPPLLQISLLHCFLRASFFKRRLSWKSENVYELHDRIVRDADFVTKEMLANTCRENGYRLYVCSTINVTHIEVYWAQWKVLEGLCLKMYWFLQYILVENTYRFIFLSFKSESAVYQRI